MSKQLFENAINAKHTGEVLKNALDFVTYLDENEIFFQDGDFSWSAKYKNETIFYIKIGGFDNETNEFIIWSADDYNSENALAQADEQLKEFAWLNVSYCGNCGGKCGPGRSTEIFGKTFNKVCHCALIFINPNAEALEKLKKLTEIRKSNIINNT